MSLDRKLSGSFINVVLVVKKTFPPTFNLIHLCLLIQPLLTSVSAILLFELLLGNCGLTLTVYLRKFKQNTV